MKWQAPSAKSLQKNSVWFGLVGLTLAVAVLVTVLAEQLEHRFGLHWDVTQNKVYSISEPTKAILAELNTDILVYTVYPQGQQDMTVTELLRRYELATSHIKVQNIDPVQTPLFTQRFANGEKTIENNAIIVALASQPEENFRVIEAKNLYEWKLEGEQLYATGLVAEQKISSAIASLLGGTEPRVYFATGHGEMNTEELYYLDGLLQNESYQVEDYHLIHNDRLLYPEDCLVFAGPMQDLTEDEYDVLKTFLKQGGKAVFLVNLMAPDLPRFNQVLQTYGLQLQSGLVVEKESNHYLNNPVILRPKALLHTATDMLFSAKADAVMSRCRGIHLTQEKGVVTGGLYQSSANSYAKTNPLTETLEWEEGDVRGPFMLAAVAENSETNSRVVVFGSTDFISSLENATYSGNLAVFMGGVSWAAGRTQSAVIAPKSLVSPPLTIASTAQSTLLIVLVVAVLPAGVLASGMVVWRRRKKQ